MKKKSTKTGKRFSTEGYKRNSPDVNNPYNIIPSGNITMKGVDFPVMGTDNLGNTKLMMPGYDYVFPGNAVFEVPMAQGGIEVPKRNGVRKNPDGSVSTHLMATETLDGKNWFSFPTLFQDPDGTWIDMSDRPWEEAYEEAKRRGEVIEFGTDKEAAIKFGEGSWKLPKAQLGNLGRIVKATGKTAKPGLIKTTAPVASTAAVVRTAPYINSGFKSSINWENWNPETVSHPELMEEYNAIEALTKENNTWMKNFDGSLFEGTPEQFVQQQSSWFNTAYPQGFENTFRGTYGPMNTVRVAEVFPGGRGIFTGDLNTANHYAGSSGLLNSLYHPITSNNYVINAGGSNWRNIPVEGIPGMTNERIEYTGKKVASTDEIAKWLEDNNLDYITINNVFDGLPADYVRVINNKPGNYLKSATGNVGFFNLNDPDIFKKDGGESLPSYQTRGEVPNEILNWQDNAEWFNNRAVFSDDPRYNDMIKKLTLAGTHGFNPTTGTLHKLETPVTVNQDVVENVTRGAAKRKVIADRKKAEEENLKKWQDARELVDISEVDAWSPDFNFETRTGIRNANDFRGQQVYMTPEEAENYHQAMMSKNINYFWNSPLMKAPGYVFLGATAPWLLAGMSAVEAADDLSKGNYGDAALSAVGALPIVPSGLKNVKRAYNKVATGNSILPVAWKMEDVSKFVPTSSIKTTAALADNEAKIIGKYLQDPYVKNPGSLDYSPLFDQVVQKNKGIYDDISVPFTRVEGYASKTTPISNKYGSTFSYDGSRSWSLGARFDDKNLANLGKTRLVIPSRYSKNLDFMPVDYTDARILQGAQEEFFKSGLDKFAPGFANDLTRFIPENEIIGNVSNGFKVIGRSNEQGFNNIFIKPIKQLGGSLPSYQTRGETGRWVSPYKPYGGYASWSRMNDYSRYQQALKDKDQTTIDMILGYRPEFENMSFDDAFRLGRDISLLSIKNQNAQLGQPFYNADRNQMEFTWNGKPYHINTYEEVPTQELIDFMQNTGNELQQIAEKAYKQYPEKSINPLGYEQEDFRFSEQGALKQYILDAFPEGSKERAFLDANPEAIKSLTDYWKPLREDLTHIVNPSYFDVKNPVTGKWHNMLQDKDGWSAARARIPGTPEYKNSYNDLTPEQRVRAIEAGLLKKNYDPNYVPEQTISQAQEHTIRQAPPERMPINPNMMFLYTSAPGFTGPNGFDMERAMDFRDQAGILGPEGLISAAAWYATGAGAARVPIYKGFTWGNAANLAWGANAVTNTLPSAYENLKEGNYWDAAQDAGWGALELSGVPGSVRAGAKAAGLGKLFNVVPTTSAGFANKYPNLNLTSQQSSWIDNVGGPALESLPLYRPSNIFRSTPKPSQYQFNKAFNLMNKSGIQGAPSFNTSGFGTNQPLLGFDKGGQLPKAQRGIGRLMTTPVRGITTTPVISSARMVPGYVGPIAAGNYINSTGTFASPVYSPNNFTTPEYNFETPSLQTENAAALFNPEKTLKSLIRPVVRMTGNLIYGANTPAVQLPKQLSGNFTDFSDVQIARNANTTAFKNQIKISPYKDHQLTSRYLNYLAEAADPLDNLIMQRISDLTSEEGFARLVQQEADYLRTLPNFPEDKIKSYSRINAKARIEELKNATSLNRNAANILQEHIAHSEAPGVPLLVNGHSNLLFNNAFHSPARDARLWDIYTGPEMFNWPPPPSPYSEGSGFLITKHPQLGAMSFPGTLGIGVPYRNNIPTMAHEIGHALQRNRVLQIDDDARTLIKPKTNLTPLERRYYNYFTDGSTGLEPTPFLNELREAMLQRGIITSRYQEITPDLLKQAYESFNSKPMGVFVENSRFAPGDRGHLSSDTRIFNFMDPTTENFNNLSGLLNRLPAITIGVGLGATALSGEDDKKQEGGEPPQFDWRNAMANDPRIIAQDNTRVAQTIVPEEFRKPSAKQVAIDFGINDVNSSAPVRVPNPSDTDATFVANAFLDPNLVPEMIKDIAINDREYFIPNVQNEFSEAAYEQQQREIKEKAKPKDYKNASAEEVIDLQKNLVSQGYSVGRTGIDGKYGSNTHTAYTNSVSDDAVDLTTIDRYYNKYKQYGPDQRVVDIQEDLVAAKLLAPDEVDGKFGPVTREAVRRYNAGPRESLDFSPTPSRISDPRCAAGMCQILEGDEIPTDQLGIKYKDAWDILESMNNQGASKTIYNIYEDPAFNEISTASELISATKAVKKGSQTNASMYNVGDIVGLFYRPSGHHEETLNSKTHNTHVGWVYSIENGVPIIAHNIGGKILKQPYTELVTTWIQRPNQNILSQSTAYRGQDLRYNTSDASEHSISNLDNLVNNAETKIERKLTEQERSIVGNTLTRANYSAHKLVDILKSDVDPNWVEEAVFGIAGAESGMGINANRTVDEVREDDRLRSMYYDITDKKDEDVSLGVTKTKFSTLDDFSRSYFDIQSPADLGDDNKNIDVTTYNIIKAYEILSDYSEKFPELGLTEQDLRNMTILAHNQGLYGLLFTGRSKNKEGMIYSEELKLLRQLYAGTVKDVSSTNWRVFGDNAITQSLISPSETYISKVNRYRNEVYNKPLAENVTPSNQGTSTFRSGGEFKIYKNYIDGAYYGTPKEKEAEKIYDKLNRVYYKDAKQSGTTVPNYILTQVMKQADN